MALRTGEEYTCTNDDCGCQIEVTRGAPDGGGDQAPRCCCGSEMKKTGG